MTLHVLSAGDGYTYYTQEVATGDIKREQGRELGDYYTADGNPPGLWLGGGIDLLGVAGTVSEDQMRALYGEGLHPNADALIAAAQAAGATAEQAQEAAKLMVAYPLIYVVCTLPLATLRMYQEARSRTVSAKWFCLAGAMITSNGWLDVILYVLTRRITLFSDDPPDDNGIETFRAPWMTGDVFGTETRC